MAPWFLFSPHYIRGLEYLLGVSLYMSIGHFGWIGKSNAWLNEDSYHGSSTVSAPKSDLTVFCPPPISINFFFVENLWGFCRPQVSLLTPIILLYDRRIWPWIIYDWFTSAVYASPNYRWIFLRPWGPKLRKNHGTATNAACELKLGHLGQVKV